jgi:hypothetical protein
VSGELREAEVDQAVQLALPVAEVLDQTNAEPNQLADLLGGLAEQRGRGGSLERGEAGDA